MKNLYTLTAIFGLTLVLSSCTPTTSSTTTSSASSAAGNNTSATSTQTYTAADVSAHSTRSDCWMIISGKVYNVTAYIPSHPGGAEILQGCGRDATEMFATKGDKNEEHSRLATQTLAKYYICDLK